MLSTSTLQTTLIRFVSSRPLSNIDIKRLLRPGFHNDAVLHRAYAKFTEQYGNWVDSFFDEHFLAHGGNAILKEFAGGRIERHQAAARLAQAWDAQMGPVRSDIRRRRVADAVMAADSLLRWYASELKRDA